MPSGSLQLMQPQKVEDHFWHLWAYYLETNSAKITKISPNLYYVPRIIVFVSIDRWKMTTTHPGLSIFFKCTTTSLFTDGTFSSNLNILHEYHMQHSLKLWGINYHFNWVKIPVALFTKILMIKNCRKCKTKIKKSFTKILIIILSVKIVLTLRVKLPCPKHKILIVREILVLSFIVSEKIEKKDGWCIGTSTWK